MAYFILGIWSTIVLGFWLHSINIANIHQIIVTTGVLSITMFGLGILVGDNARRNV